MQIEIRRLDTARDLPELAAMLDRVMTDGMTVARLKAQAEMPARVNRIMVGTAESRIVGWSMLVQLAEDPRDQAFTSVIAHPDHRLGGIGSAMLSDVIDHARSLGVRELKSRVKDSEPGWLSWAQSKGFEVRRHTFRSSIRLADFDGTDLFERVSDLEAQGIEFTTLAEIGDTEKNRKRYYEVGTLAARDTPGVDALHSWEEYAAHTFGDEDYRPEGAFLALSGDSIVGVAHVLLDSEHDRMYNEFTGVHPQYRGRGIAQALKLLTIRHARASGVSEILTENDSENAPMLAINRKLGYRPWPGAYELRGYIVGSTAS